jgi:hypothetical protein
MRPILEKKSWFTGVGQLRSKHYFRQGWLQLLGRLLRNTDILLTVTSTSLD